MMNMNQEQFNKLIEKLDLLIKLNALSAVRDKPRIDSILFLADLGFGNVEIAQILGLSPKTVSNVKSENKKDKSEKSVKTVEFHSEDLLDILSNSDMFPSVIELMDFARDILSLPLSLPINAPRSEIINQISQAFKIVTVESRHYLYKH